MTFWISIKLKSGKVRQFSLVDGFLILEAWFALAFFNLALRCISLQRLQGASSSLITRSVESDRQVDTAAHVCRLAGIVAGLHPWLRMPCLVRALALRWMLRRRGIPLGEPSGRLNVYFRVVEWLIFPCLCGIISVTNQKNCDGNE